MTARTRVPERGHSLPPGTLTRIAKGYTRSTLYRTIESAAKMLGNNPSVWHDQTVLIVSLPSSQSRSHSSSSAPLSAGCTRPTSCQRACDVAR